MSSVIAKGVALGQDGTTHPDPVTQPQDFRFVSPSGAAVKDHFSDTGTTWVRMWIDLSYFFPSEGAVNPDLFAQLAAQITAANSAGLKVMLTMWKFPRWMNGTTGLPYTGPLPVPAGQWDTFQQGPEVGAEYKFPDDVSAASAWGWAVAAILSRFSAGRPGGVPAGEPVIDSLEILNEPNWSYFPQSDRTRARTAGCKCGQMLVSAVAINAWYGNQTIIAGPGIVAGRFLFETDGLSSHIQGSPTNPQGDPTGALALHTDAVVFARDVVSAFSVASTVPGPKCVFTVHNYGDVSNQTLVVAEVREYALRGTWAGHPDQDVNNPRLWITEGGFTAKNAADMNPTAPDPVSYFHSLQAIRVYAAFNKMRNNGHDAATGGAGIDVVMNFLFESTTVAKYDCGLMDPVVCGAGGVKRPGRTPFFGPPAVRAGWV